MNATDKEILRQLGKGSSIDSLCKELQCTQEEFDQWWKRTAESRVPDYGGQTLAGVTSKVEIERDRWGIPHIYADNDKDLFLGFGYAVAQDRLFQLDFLRRRGLGRLSEILGKEGLERDTIARTVGLNRTAAAEWERLSDDVRETIESFSAGINAWIEQSVDKLPIEFDLLGYQPEPWTPIDCLAIESEFRWYLTGRFPVIVIPELAKRALGEGRLCDEFLLGESDEESIIHPGDYTPRSGEYATDSEPVGHVMGDPDDATGSNNWVVGGNRTTTGLPLLASDPHIAIEAVSCWYEAHLCGGSFNVAGMSYVGIPAIMFGRNEHVAWGITNNICSQRDLYLEQTSDDYPDCFRYGDEWERAKEIVEEINVRDSETVTKTIRCSRNGPVVNEILPAESKSTFSGETVTLKWLGSYQGGWLTSLLAVDRATDVDSFRESLRPWHVPTFSLVIADTEGHIGFQSSGRIPIRKSIERGLRSGWDPEHQWQGLIPFDEMPRASNPERGWIASANNRLAPNDFPYRLFGCWVSGWRGVRIRQMIESAEQLTPDDMGRMHQDKKSLRAEALVPRLLKYLESSDDERTREATPILSSWDFQVQPESVAATIFNVFFDYWCRAIASERFHDEQVQFMASAAAGIAGRLLDGDSAGWFAANNREDKIADAFSQTLQHLAERFGDDMNNWHWERLHRMPLAHVLSSRGDLAGLLNLPDSGVGGDMVTVCNTGSGPDWSAPTGAGYRLVANLASQPPSLLAVDGQSQSGHPGSKNYNDQFGDWISGRYHEIHLDRSAASEHSIQRLTLSPTGSE